MTCRLYCRLVTACFYGSSVVAEWVAEVDPLAVVGETRTLHLKDVYLVEVNFRGREKRFAKFEV